MINYIPFGLSCNNNVVDIKQLVNSVTTIQWATTHKEHLSRHTDKLARFNSDHRWIIGSILQAAYGGVLGLQISERLKPADFETIKNNILNK